MTDPLRPYGDSTRWILDGHTPRPCSREHYEKHRSEHSWDDLHRVALTQISKEPDISVSTVFLGIDHNMRGVGPPILFETMVFGGSLDQEMKRYETLEAAELGHALMVERVRKG